MRGPHPPQTPYQPPLPAPLPPEGALGEAPVLFGPGTVPVTGLVGAELAGDEGAGDVKAGSPAVVPCSSEQAARPSNAPAIGMMSESFLSILFLTSCLGSHGLREVRRLPVNAADWHNSVTRAGRYLGRPHLGHRHEEPDRMETPRRITSFAAILGEVDAFLLDQFGTLHDGTTLYPGVVEAMAALRRAGKRLLILSNSGKRAQPNIARLAAIGLPPETYDGFLSSGEVAWQLLAEGRLPGLAAARRCLVLSRGEDAAALAGLNLERTADAAHADLILLLGSEADRFGLDSYRERLAPAAARGVLCLCGNPDRSMVLSDGRLAPAAGRIAELYAAMGGPVASIGKPGAAIYEAAFDMLRASAGAAIDRSRVWAVGDSIEHDVAGAASQGCRSLLVMTGIMAGQGGAEIAAEAAQWGAAPDAVMPAFA
jgi:HAD superfamily hydrolase (TIGR01459 family)